MDNLQALCDLLAVHEDDGDDEEGSFIDILTVFKFSGFDSGCWKRVYQSPLFPNIVLKHAVSVRGQGFAEVTNYQTAPKTLRPFLLPLLAHSRRLQIQPFITFHECPDDCKGAIAGMIDSGPNNHTHDEDGQLIIVDYGQTNQWCY